MPCQMCRLRPRVPLPRCQAVPLLVRFASTQGVRPISIQPEILGRQTPVMIQAPFQQPRRPSVAPLTPLCISHHDSHSPPSPSLTTPSPLQTVLILFASTSPKRTPP